MFTIRCILCLFNIQVTTYNEDFKAERSDRERAQATIQVQKDEMAGIKQMIVVMVSKIYSIIGYVNLSPSPTCSSITRAL